MGMYGPTNNVGAADPLAMANSLLAVDVAIQTVLGNGAISGLTVNSSGVLSTGYALIGHICQVGTAINILPLITSSATWDVYLQTNAYSAQSSGLGVVGTYPNSNGYEVMTSSNVKIVTHGGAAPSGAASILIATVTGSSSSLSAEDNTAGGLRNNIAVPTGLQVAPNKTKTSVTATYTALAADGVIYADATSGAFTVTLPTAVGVSGKEYFVKRMNSGSNAVTVGTTSSQTIDGSTTLALSSQYQVARLISDGANWGLF